MNFDCVVVGSGISGLVFAERFAAECAGRVLVVEQRKHIGGNCHDEIDEHGVLVHPYGPHIFHTASERVWRYLSRFTGWRPYQHKVLAAVDGMLLPVPFNLNSIRLAFPADLAARFEEALVEEFGFGARVPILQLKGQAKLEPLWRYIYDKIYVNYTMKQWGLGPEEMDESVTARVPVLASRDDRYFQDTYQGMPDRGYHTLFSRLVDQAGVVLMSQCDALELLKLDPDSGKIEFMGKEFGGLLVYTGLIDRLFSYEYGKLPYRSIEFEFESLEQECCQSVAVVNYPNEFDYTRITEYKHLTGQTCAWTSLSKEYPCDFEDGKNTPCYPIKTDENARLAERYREKAKRFENLICLGRLADYAYYNMDAAVERALDAFDNYIQGRRA